MLARNGGMPAAEKNPCTQSPQIGMARMDRAQRAHPALRAFGKFSAGVSVDWRDWPVDVLISSSGPSGRVRDPEVRKPSDNRPRRAARAAQLAGRPVVF